MPRHYVLLRRDGERPTVEFLGLFSRSSAATDAAQQLAPGLAWEDVGNPGGPLQLAEATSNVWEHYAIVRLEEDVLANPPVAL